MSLDCLVEKEAVQNKIFKFVCISLTMSHGHTLTCINHFFFMATSVESYRLKRSKGTTNATIIPLISFKKEDR